jgi:aspartyl-tRNA(Asn)/glutamyl-tRNA(Gln) amidotransferase subunit A
VKPLDDEVAFAGIGELAPRLRHREISAIDLTELYLDRIARYAGRMNAFARVTPERARAEARQADAELRAGRYRGPLHGIPYGAKDLFDSAGIATEWGTRACRGRIPERDATVIERLRESGAILLGKLAMVEFAGCVGYRYPNASVSGPGRNPWNLSRWTGGSSSGSGAAVASGLVGFALGTETWGSILCPSAFCGITGLRPTYGRVSRHGGMVGSFSFDKIGPLARSAADCRLVLQAIAGNDPDDPTSSDRSISELVAKHRDPGNVRVAIVDMDWNAKGAEAEVRHAFDAAIETLREIGFTMTPAKLPELPASEMAGLIITAEAMSTFERFYRDGRIRQLDDPWAPYQQDLNRAIGGDDLVKAWRIRRHVQEKMAEWFADYDVIATPNFLSVAPPVDSDLNQTLPYSDPAGGIGNSCGFPSLALPAGIGRGSMPCGFQLMAAPWDEGLLADLGERFQQRTEFHRARPAAYAAG